MSWQDIPGWFAFQPTYDEMVSRCPDGGTIVEIGVAFGRSVAYLARKVIDSGKKITIYAVDPWRDDWWMPPNDYPADAPRPTWGGEYAELGRTMGGPFSAFVQCMRTHAPEELERINVLRCYSAEAAQMIGDADSVMIDGNHNYAQVLSDIQLWWPKVKRGGVCAGDDYHQTDFPGVVQAVKEAFEFSRVDIRGTTWVVNR